MTPPDDIFAKKITAYLDQDIAELKPGIAYRLQLARAEAVARLTDPVRSAEVRGAVAHAGGASATAGRGKGIWSSGRLWVGIGLIVAAGFGYQQWQAYQQMNEIEETDAAILSSELPIDAYLDRGFQNWLKSASYDE